jgi:hypothetical protein
MRPAKIGALQLILIHYVDDQIFTDTDWNLNDAFTFPTGCMYSKALLLWLAVKFATVTYATDMAKHVSAWSMNVY